MHRFVRLVLDRRPNWASARENGTGIDVDISLKTASGRPRPTVHLHFWADSQLRVKQREPKIWPEGCPERHIEREGTFCLGKARAPLRPSRDAEADAWWEWLKQFLYAQFFADKNGFWPSDRALHHGNAADSQLKMEELARSSFLETDVAMALEARTGWLAGKLPRLTKDQKHLTNLRSPCPRGCFKRKTPLPKGARRRVHPILRKGCKQKELILALIKLEYERRKKEDEFWASHPRKVCCGTMRDCPLRKKS